mmetsp:Transcript_38124/g.120399  ORF Transcript_38124/g.120399 Transcript_38124/m.120399 type:complete len:294 (-) Transcript_38124:460-1341(-)
MSKTSSMRRARHWRSSAPPPAPGWKGSQCTSSSPSLRPSGDGAPRNSGGALRRRGVQPTPPSRRKGRRHLPPRRPSNGSAKQWSKAKARGRPEPWSPPPHGCREAPSQARAGRRGRPGPALPETLGRALRVFLVIALPILPPAQARNRGDPAQALRATRGRALRKSPSRAAVERRVMPIPAPLPPVQAGRRGWIGRACPPPRPQGAPWPARHRGHLPPCASETRIPGSTRFSKRRRRRSSANSRGCAATFASSVSRTRTAPASLCSPRGPRRRARAGRAGSSAGRAPESGPPS